MIIQFCGLSGSGKTTLATNVKKIFHKKDIDVEIIDGDEYRKVLCADLGFSKEDRNQNIKRLAFVASRLSNYNIISIICAINPYEDVRKEVAAQYNNVKTVFIDCDINTLIQRDTKGLYKKAYLPDGHPDKVKNLTGVNDPFEIPANPDLVINTSTTSVEDAVQILTQFILDNI